MCVDAGRVRSRRRPAAQRYFDHAVIDFNEVTRLGKDHGHLRLRRDRARPPNTRPKTPTSRLRLWQMLKPRLAAEHVTNVYETLERPLVAVLARMEGAAFRSTGQTLRDCPSEFATESARLEGEIQKLAGQPFNPGSPEADRRRAVRLDGPARRHQDQDRTVVDRREGAGRPRRAGPRTAAEDSRLAAGLEAALDLYRRAAELCRSENAARAHELRARGDDHRPPVVVRTQPAEHPDPHRGRAQDPHAPSSRTRATSWSRPTIRRSSCACWPKSPTCRRCARPSRTASTFTP